MHLECGVRVCNVYAMRVHIIRIRFAAATIENENFMTDTMARAGEELRTLFL